MIVPKRHVTMLGSETEEEVLARERILNIAAIALQKLYPGAGIEVFLQTGEGSESSEPHLHWHVVPALPGDSLRGFDKLGHFYTVQPGQEKVIIFPVAIKLAREELIHALAEILK